MATQDIENKEKQMSLAQLLADSAGLEPGDKALVLFKSNPKEAVMVEGITGQPQMQAVLSFMTVEFVGVAGEDRDTELGLLMELGSGVPAPGVLVFKQESPDGRPVRWATTPDGIMLAKAPSTQVAGVS